MTISRRTLLTGAAAVPLVHCFVAVNGRNDIYLAYGNRESLTITVISGSGGSGHLGPGFAYDCVEMS
jgi:hypothetical protein